MTSLSSYALTLRGRDYSPLIVGGMGTNISTAELGLAVEKLGGISHLSDAMLMDVWTAFSARASLQRRQSSTRA
ncbi:MAG: hypothetical protein V8T46_03515 [Sutterella seckii]